MSTTDNPQDSGKPSKCSKIEHILSHGAHGLGYGFIRLVVRLACTDWTWAQCLYALRADDGSWSWEIVSSIESQLNDERTSRRHVRALPHRQNAATLAKGVPVYTAAAVIATTVSGVTVFGEEEFTCTGTGNGGEVECAGERVFYWQGTATTQLVASFVATVTQTVMVIEAAAQAATKAPAADAASRVASSFPAETSLFAGAYVTFFYVIF
ncbi:hypothetical protein HYPSUDRAFT_202197 [Hypholoma sublateritium FD-334 SS-4]|uniref:Uncharacterized protein n=1 Tax=Hypholoma sublateritium (strain FD-334 SS-4) TaxID=945553 RepID=A0A0D2P120_HYPSF|nr:hypothetical protein HYPSUDRAFT_202197 [Hypholoma sublateritium FD-334 SS-4]